MSGTNRTRTIAALAVLVLCAGLLAGCSKPEPKLSSPWPRAERERVVPKPPEPLVWPYTGQKAPKESAIRRRPISVKIENSAASRPQTGIGTADVVYETISEGGITRFNCIFHSKVPDVIGPVRSARLSDLWVVPQYDALFFFSGASSSVNRKINNAGLPNLSEDAGVSAPFSRSSSRPAPHNLYLDGTQAYATAKSRGQKITAKLEPLHFERRSQPASSAVTEISIPFSPANSVRWVYGKDGYKRFNNGAPHQDQGLGRQVTADNVVVIWAKHDPVSRDKVGSTTYDIVLGGKGRVSVFHSGRRYDGTWTAERNAPPRFVDADGRPIRLAKGRTWFQIIPLNGAITMK